MRKTFLLLSLLLMGLFSIGIFSQAVKDVKPVPKERHQLHKKPLPRIKMFQIHDIKAISKSPTKVKFKVSYYINPSYKKACFISAYVPNKAGQSLQFAYNPAGRRPKGVPKGQRYFRDNVTFEVNYRGKKAYASKTIEVVIYDAGGNKITKRFQFAHNWGPIAIAPYRFEIQGIKRVLTTPTRVKWQVQYYISPHYPKACFIGAYINNQAAMAPGIVLNPAGRLPNGVPKGQKHFTNNITFEMSYNGSGTFRSSSIEVTIYDKDKKTLKKQLFQWGQVWGQQQ